MKQPSMQKQECNYCQNNPGQRCVVCDNNDTDSNNTAIQANLYAAEFMLYAFHFDQHNVNAGQGQRVRIP